MSLNIISKVVEGVGGSVSKIMESAASLKRIKSVDKTQQENNIHEETVAMVKAFAAEMGKENKTIWDSIVDGINRLIRPIIACIAICLLLICLIDPKYADSVANAFSGLPNNLYYILLTIISFYFGGRIIQGMKKEPPRMSAEQHTSLMTMVQTTEKKITESNAEVILDNKKVLEALLDDNDDGLDDRGVKHIEDSEGWRSKLYKCPAGKLTIGYGFNLEAQELPKEIGKLWLVHIIKSVIKTLKSKYPFIDKLDTVRFWIIIDMAYNLGVYNTNTLKSTLDTLEKELSSNRPNYKKVAKVMRSSKWFSQVGNRSKILVNRMETGKWN